MKLGFRLARAEETATKSQRWRKGIQLIRLTSAVLWVCAVSTGLWILWGYENTPGASAQPPDRWPAGSRIQRAHGSATLVMLAHPHCPCTRASIGELARLMTQSEGRVTAYVLFLKPAGFSDNWEKTDLWKSVVDIPGASALIDDEGTEARRFHAQTSGQTMLYDAEGRLLFSGGITGSRGHAGDNAGRSAILSLVNTGEAVQTETFVFGCQLFGANSECRESTDERNKH